MLAGHKATFDCIKAFSETDCTEDLKKFNVPTLIVHGDDDQIVPIGASAMLSAQLVKGSTLKVYSGFSHGMCSQQGWNQRRFACLHQVITIPSTRTAALSGRNTMGLAPLLLSLDLVTR